MKYFLCGLKDDTRPPFVTLESSRSMVIEANDMEQAIGRYLAAIEADLLGNGSVTAREIDIVKIWDND